MPRVERHRRAQGPDTRIREYGLCPAPYSAVRPVSAWAFGSLPSAIDIFTASTLAFFDHSYKQYGKHGDLEAASITRKVIIAKAFEWRFCGPLAKTYVRLSSYGASVGATSDLQVLEKPELGIGGAARI